MNAIADFAWGSSGYNDPRLIEGESDPKIRFKDDVNEKIVPATLANYPLHESGHPNALACVTPDWPSAGDVTVSMSINGKDVGGHFTYRFTDKTKG